LKSSAASSVYTGNGSIQQSEACGVTVTLAAIAVARCHRQAGGLGISTAREAGKIPKALLFPNAGLLCFADWFPFKSTSSDVAAEATGAIELRELAAREIENLRSNRRTMASQLRSRFTANNRNPQPP
jgi:hypothetical protein